MIWPARVPCGLAACGTAPDPIRAILFKDLPDDLGGAVCPAEPPSQACARENDPNHPTLQVAPRRRCAFYEHTEPQKEPGSVSALVEQNSLFRVLTLVGRERILYAPRESKGWYVSTLDKRFELIFGTTAGAIITALLALGRTIDEIHDLFNSHVVSVMLAISN